MGSTAIWTDEAKETATLLLGIGGKIKAVANEVSMTPQAEIGDAETETETEGLMDG